MKIRPTSTSDAPAKTSAHTPADVAGDPGAASAPVKTSRPEPEIVPIHDWIFWTMRWLYGVFFRLGGWKVHGRENIPARGPVIITPNHVSMFDPPLVGRAVNRPVTTMGKAELFEKKTCGFKILGFIIQHMATFPVRRATADRRALRRAITVLKEGGALVVFPEGTRTKDGSLGPAEAGLAMIAHASRAPIVPTYLKGTERGLSNFHRGVRPIRAEVWFGRPLYFAEEYDRRSDKATLQAITNRVMQEIGRLGDAARGSDLSPSSGERNPDPNAGID